MALYKDGKVYRTYEEQVDHLTNEHIKQIGINEDVSRQLQDLGIAANLGGYNLVRFAFRKSGTFYQLVTQFTLSSPESEVGDYFEVTSKNQMDIPAYGYVTSKQSNLVGITYSFLGDFQSTYSTLTFINVTKKSSL